MNRSVTGATSAFAAVVVVAVATVALLSAQTDSPTSDTEWADLSVPWLQEGRVHSAGSEMPQPAELLAVTATVDSALISAGSKVTELTSSGTTQASARTLWAQPSATAPGICCLVGIFRDQ